MLHIWLFYLILACMFSHISKLHFQFIPLISVSCSLPRQHAEVSRISLVFVVDYVPVSVVHLNALQNTESWISSGYVQMEKVSHTSKQTFF